MNNSDISSLINMLGQMDKKQLASGINKLNQILSPEEKQELYNLLDNKK